MSTKPVIKAELECRLRVALKGIQPLLGGCCTYQSPHNYCQCNSLTRERGSVVEW